MTTNTTTTPTPKPAMDPVRKAALVAGLCYIGTFVFSIPALALYDGVLNDPNFVLGAGGDRGVLWGGLIEILTALTGIGTAVALYPVIKRHGAGRALGFVGARVLEAAMIFAGVLAVLSIVTLRHDLAGTGADPATLTTVAHALVAFKDWTFLLGPGLMAVVNALCLATIMHRSGLVPRAIPTLGLIGAPVLLASSTASLFGAWEQVSAPAVLMALPIAAWEFSLGVYMTVKGFRHQAADDAVEAATPASAFSATVAA
jgi:hypothetical protein